MLNLLRWVGSHLSFRWIALLIVALAVALGCWKLYDHILDIGIAQGKAEQTKIDEKSVSDANKRADDLQGKLTAAQGTLQANQTAFDTWKATAAANTAAAQQAQDKVNQDLSQQLAKTESALATIKKQKDDLSKYISKANDAACTLPNGFVFLYDQSLTAANPLLALPTGVVAYAPSGLSLSGATRVILDNNAAARENRDKVIQWQTWWASVQVILSKYKLPPVPEPLKNPSP